MNSENIMLGEEASHKNHILYDSIHIKYAEYANS